MAQGYRALPNTVYHPKKYKIISENDFNNLGKTKMQEAPSICEGHKLTTVWYCEKIGYIVQIDFNDSPKVLINTPCTITPTAGMDSIDGAFAQDAEEYILNRILNYNSERLKIFDNRESVDVSTYLKLNGFQFNNKNEVKKKWWEFWK